MRQRLLLMDIEVQRDFFQPGGALYTSAVSPVRGNVYRLFDWARTTGVPVISTVLLVRPGDQGPLSRVPHCIEGSGGEVRPERTQLANRVNLGLGTNTDVPVNVLETHQQVIFEKRNPDIFQHSKAERLISELAEQPGEKTVVVCGAGVAWGIKQAVVGLRTRGFGVVIAEDAVLDLSDPQAEMAWLQMLAKAARPLPTAQIVREFLPPRRPIVQPLDLSDPVETRSRKR